MAWFTRLQEFFTVESPEVRRERAERLEALAAIVSAHVRDYATVGQALAEIQSRELYKITHATFEEFVETRWQMSKAHAYRLIKAAETISRLSPRGDKPTERMLRPLTSLPPAEQIAAYEEAENDAGDEPLTLDHIERAASKRKPGKARKQKATPKPTRLRVPGANITIEPTKAFTTVEQALLHALEQIRSRAAA